MLLPQEAQEGGNRQWDEERAAGEDEADERRRFGTTTTKISFSRRLVSFPPFAS
jgi:hypothetical protein